MYRPYARRGCFLLLVGLVVAAVGVGILENKEMNREVRLVGLPIRLVDTGLFFWGSYLLYRSKGNAAKGNLWVILLGPFGMLPFLRTNDRFDDEHVPPEAATPQSLSVQEFAERHFGENATTKRAAIQVREFLELQSCMSLPSLSPEHSLVDDIEIHWKPTSDQAAYFSCCLPAPITPAEIGGIITVRDLVLWLAHASAA